jgi:hypothetical protein
MRGSSVPLAVVSILFNAALPPASSRADSSVLEGGVLILHNPIEQSLSIEPPEGWCQNYRDHYAITGATQQVNRIDAYPYEGCGKTWFVLAAWDEPKDFRAVEFGIGAYGEEEWLIFDSGPCFPAEGIVEATPGWPGAHQGVRLTATTGVWSGNYVPVYFFCGIGYYEGDPHLFPLAPHPVTGVAGFTNALTPPQSWGAACLGAMGWRTDGAPCDPATPQGLPPEEPPQPASSWSAIKSLYR